jgi:hypothetical protein
MSFAWAGIGGAAIMLAIAIAYGMVTKNKRNEYSAIPN